MLYQISRDAFFDRFRANFGSLKQAQVNALEALLARIESDSVNWESLSQLAYGLATFKWETANTFEPVVERGPDSYFKKYEPGTRIGKKLGNTKPGDGLGFKGRGFVQITGRANYRRVGSLLGLDLVASPDKALEFSTAYDIAARGMHNGWFTGRKLSHYFPENGPAEWENARQIINGLDRAAEIADIGRKMLEVLTASARVRELADGAVAS